MQPLNPTAHTTPPTHVFDATTATFEADVLQRSLQVPVLIDFWAEWCGPCKTLGPMLEKLAADHHGAFVLAKIDVDAEQELAAAFQIRSIPTVILVKDGQPVDGFPGAVPEGQLREFLQQHGIVPATPPEDVPAQEDATPVPVDLQAEVARLRGLVAEHPDAAGHRLDLAVALLQTGDAVEAEQLLDALPVALAMDDRAVRARARLGFASLLADAPPPDALEAAIARDPDDLRARHLLGVHHVVAGRSEDGLEQFLEILQRDRGFGDGLAKRALIDAFRIVDDAAVVGRYRRRMSSLLLV